ncbi:G-protein coupled receptor 54-like [Ylistrum balloti]|uniref:G-protein coupled receptor 54-like n=1 Tax=Ylistrum balloti TaxID=509963 RepID=UPI002905E6BB|nr:G-protein coupled receptor 54-like [Ylistrum balloti]
MAAITALHMSEIIQSTTDAFVNATGSTNTTDVGTEFSVLLPALWSVLIVIGTVGNGLVIYTVGKNGEMTATNCYVLNLAVADLLFLMIVVPFTTTGFATKGWIFGDAICKIYIYMIYVTMHATCLTLTAMTVDRYHAIVHPVSSMNWRSRRASTIVSIVVWAISLLISIPFAIYHGAVNHLNPSKHVYCAEIYPTVTLDNIISVGVIITTYVFPLSVIVICYYSILKYIWNGRTQRSSSFKHEEDCNGSTPLSSESQVRRRRRVTRMVSVVVLLFATFWFPIHVYNICRKSMTIPQTSIFYGIKIFAHTLSYANSCVNPFVYAFLNDGFKKAFAKTFPSLYPWCPCMRMVSDERHTQVTGMVDQAIQAMPEDDNDAGVTKPEALPMTRVQPQTDL